MQPKVGHDCELRKRRLLRLQLTRRQDETIQSDVWRPGGDQRRMRRRPLSLGDARRRALPPLVRGLPARLPLRAPSCAHGSDFHPPTRLHEICRRPWPSWHICQGIVVRIHGLEPGFLLAPRLGDTSFQGTVALLGLHDRSGSLRRGKGARGDQGRRSFSRRGDTVFPTVVRDTRPTMACFQPPLWVSSFEGARRGDLPHAHVRASSEVRSDVELDKGRRGAQVE